MLPALQTCRAWAVLAAAAAAAAAAVAAVAAPAFNYCRYNNFAPPYYRIASTRCG